MAVTHAVWSTDNTIKSKWQISKLEGTFWQKSDKWQLCGVCRKNKTVQLYYNTKINGEYNK